MPWWVILIGALFAVMLFGVIVSLLQFSADDARDEAIEREWQAHRARRRTDRRRSPWDDDDEAA